MSATNGSDGLPANETQHSNATTPKECGVPTNDGALFEFVTTGIVLNLVGLFGLFGNIISMIILSRPQMKSSINYLLIGLARCDTFFIITAILLFGLPAIYPYTDLLYNYKFIIYPRLVRFLYPLANIAQMVSVYLTLTVTMERYVAVCLPLRARSMCTYGRARLAVLLIVLVATIYNLPKFWELTIVAEKHWKYQDRVYCVYPTELRRNELYGQVYVHWMYLLFYYLIPFTLLLVFNLAIYRQVRKANRELQHLSHHQRREIGLATMLLCVVMVFLICNVLPLVTNVFETFVHLIPMELVQSGNLMVTINCSVNFVIYVIFGRKFKRIFLQLFCSASFFGPGRDSPEFQTNDESFVTNVTNIELRNSIRRSNLHRSSTVTSRNNNVHSSHGNSNPGQGVRSGKTKTRSASPGPCVYYPARSPVRSPSQTSRASNNDAPNGWDKSHAVDATPQ